MCAVAGPPADVRGLPYTGNIALHFAGSVISSSLAVKQESASPAGLSRSTFSRCVPGAVSAATAAGRIDTVAGDDAVERVVDVAARALGIRPHVDDRKHREAVRAVVDASRLVRNPQRVLIGGHPVRDDVAVDVIAAGQPVDV